MAGRLECREVGRQVVGRQVGRLVGRLVGRQVGRHEGIYIASFEPLQKLVLVKEKYIYFVPNNNDSCTDL